MSKPVSGVSISRCRKYLWPVVALSSVAILLAQQTWLGGATLNNPKTAARAVTPRGDLMAEEKSTIALFKQASPSVLNITSIGIERDMFTPQPVSDPPGYRFRFYLGQYR